MTQSVFSFDEAIRLMRHGASTADQAADRLLAGMSDAERLQLLDGDVPRLKVFTLPRLIAAGRIDRLGIPGIRFSDGAGW